jgi:hypothetical protein
MTNEPKKLGLNCSIFENFIEKNRIYVDKTKIIYQLITAPNIEHFYFVSRPRRFGKSLFLSTLKAIFSGKKELFREYWIGKESNYDWPMHPVIHLDFGGIEHKTGERLEQNLCLALQRIAEHYNVALLKSMSPGSMLIDLVRELSKINKVVLLIDEYDKPILDHIDNLLLADEIRRILGSFYATVKSLEEYWRAIFITGVSKFAKTSLFSGLNNLTELSLDPAAAELFGYTEQELVTYFSVQIDDLGQHVGKTRKEILSEMKAWYDGYRFSKDMEKQQMYSPLSVVACLVNKQFSNYWFSTGTPGFLIALLRKNDVDLDMDGAIYISVRDLDHGDIHSIPLYTFLLQTGYLTIVDYDAETGLFTLDYPNREARESFKDYLLQAFPYATSAAIEMEL